VPVNRPQPEAAGHIRHVLKLADGEETTNLGRIIAKELKVGDVIALQGDLGAGKSHLARGILHALGITGVIPSPTFTLVQHYDINPGPQGIAAASHADLYRLAGPDDVSELGLEEVLDDGILLIEWPDRGGDLIPLATVMIHLAPDGGEDGRIATVTAPENRYDSKSFQGFAYG